VLGLRIWRILRDERRFVFDGLVVDDDFELGSFELGGLLQSFDLFFMLPALFLVELRILGFGEFLLFAVEGLERPQIFLPDLISIDPGPAETQVEFVWDLVLPPLVLLLPRMPKLIFPLLPPSVMELLGVLLLEFAVLDHLLKLFLVLWDGGQFHRVVELLVDAGQGNGCHRVGSELAELFPILLIRPFEPSLFIVVLPLLGLELLVPGVLSLILSI